MIKFLLIVIFFGWFFVVIIPLMWIHCIFRKHIKIKTRYNYLKFVLKVVSFALRIKYHVEGMENIPSEGPVLIVGNHQSAFDPLALITIIKTPITFVSKKETRKQPYIGTFVKNLDGYFIDRENLLDTARLFKVIGEDLKNGRNRVIVIFPEGTRTTNTDLSLLNFKPGALKPAYNSKATIVPLYLSGTYRALKRKWQWRNHLYIKFGTPIKYEEYQEISTVDLAKKLHDDIQINADKLKEKTPMEDWYKKHF